MSRFPLFAAVIAALVACDEEPLACDEMAVGSVNLTVVDGIGATVPEATATYSVDGAAPVACERVGDDQFVCGYEVEGTFVVRADAPQYDAVEQTVTVAADECHVIPEQLTLTLPGPPCDDASAPSIEVTVAGSSGEALSGVSVTYAPSGGGDDAPCEEGVGIWVCGWEEAGDFVVVASADGHATEVADVTVEANACQVITEYVDFSLDWLPD